MIRGFLFDYDGVITKSNDATTPPSVRLTEVLNLPNKEVDVLFSSFWPDYLRGKLSDESLWKQIEEKTGQSIPSDKRDIWRKWDQLRPLPEMVSFVASLRSQGYPVGLLTNVTPTTEQEVYKGGGYKGFDFHIKSCQVGFAKPDPEIYLIALKHLEGMAAEEVVLIDDRNRFLTPAQKLGMKTVLATGSRQVINDMHVLLDK